MLGYWFPSTTTISERARRRYGVESRIANGVALTFDDGPHPEGTPAVLDALGDERATFFLVGEQVEQWPHLVELIVGAGHEIGVHCHRHVNLLRSSPRATRADIAHAAEIISDAAGREPVLYRPPYGILNAAALSYAKGRGWRTVLWSRWGKDWQRRATAESIAARVLPLHDGDVVLLHDADWYSARGSWRKTADALPPILRTDFSLTTL